LLVKESNKHGKDHEHHHHHHHDSNSSKPKQKGAMKEGHHHALKPVELYIENISTELQSVKKLCDIL